LNETFTVAPHNENNYNNPKSITMQTDITSSEEKIEKSQTITSNVCKPVSNLSGGPQRIPVGTPKNNMKKISQPSTPNLFSPFRKTDSTNNKLSTPVWTPKNIGKPQRVPASSPFRNPHSSINKLSTPVCTPKHIGKPQRVPVDKNRKYADMSPRKKLTQLLAKENSV
jgi:hypothetical protein